MGNDKASARVAHRVQIPATGEPLAEAEVARHHGGARCRDCALPTHRERLKESCVIWGRVFGSAGASPSRKGVWLGGRGSKVLPDHC